MRSVALGTLMAIGIAVLNIGPSSAAPISIGKVGDANAFVGFHQHAQYGGYCETLRRACLYKEQLGEVGDGNCRRYRRECGGGGGFRESPRYDRQYGGGGGRCTYWQNRCANAYGWHTRSWHKCMKYGAPGC